MAIYLVFITPIVASPHKPLKVLTIIHNFDIKRDDGSSPAQRLFGYPFPDLFESVVPLMGQLPRPRRTLKTPKSKKPTL
jgi:Family of unknown function (DUF6399)